MNKTDHLLVILGEECSELAVQISKALRFGLHERRDLQTSNRERMQAEYNDLLAVVEMLNWHDGSIDLHRDDERIAAKKAKVAKYLEYSYELGRINWRDEK